MHHHKDWSSIETLDKIQDRKKKKTATNNSRTRAEEVKNRQAPVNSPDVEAAHTDLPIVVIPATIKEIIGKMKSGKAAEPDNILVEAPKLDIEVTASMLHTLFKKIWEEEQVSK
ncbi:unnamed protein product [Schistosoma curassoni]|uniref:NET domain-containing protein n=1 Tax=Schistosoma curassoni TaxID=6186 RepID=A0A183KH27_9TREM|nr:unnamed protein product [Schistosoma curassoni]